MIQDKVSQRKSVHSVFSYGTLTGKFPERVSQEAELIGNYSLDESGWYPELREGQNEITVRGVILELSDSELQQADEYESDLYTRKILEVNTDIGPMNVWVYLAN